MWQIQIQFMKLHVKEFYLALHIYLQVGLLDKEVNSQTKVLFLAVLALSIVMMCLKVGLLLR